MKTAHKIRVAAMALLVSTGCTQKNNDANENGRFAIAVSASGKTVVRVDTRTGELWQCGAEAGTYLGSCENVGGPVPPARSKWVPEPEQ